MSFPCTKCGLCCLKAKENFDGFVKQGLDFEFEYGFNEDGSCEQYDKETRLCKVYENRPLICRIEEWRKHAHPEINERFFNLITAIACNHQMNEAGIDGKYRIDLMKI